MLRERCDVTCGGFAGSNHDNQPVAFALVQATGNLSKDNPAHACSCDMHSYLASSLPLCLLLANEVALSVEPAHALGLAPVGPGDRGSQGLLVLVIEHPPPRGWHKFPLQPTACIMGT